MRVRDGTRVTVPVPGSRRVEVPGQPRSAAALSAAPPAPVAAPQPLPAAWAVRFSVRDTGWENRGETPPGGGTDPGPGMLGRCLREEGARDTRTPGTGTLRQPSPISVRISLCEGRAG